MRNSPLGLVDPSGMDPFGPGDQDDCGDDPFCGWAYWPPPIIFPPIIDEPIPQIPAPPPPPTPIAIQNTTGVYAQGQWGGVSNSILPGGPVLVGTGGTATIVIDIIGGTICVGTGVCEAIAIGAGAVALGAAAYIIYRTHANGAKSNQSTASKSKVTDAVREECEQYAHSRADRYGPPRYQKQWMKDYTTCIAHGGIENIPD